MFGLVEGFEVAAVKAEVLSKAAGRRDIAAVAHARVEMPTAVNQIAGAMMAARLLG